MTLQEVCQKYNVSESSMKTAFPRTQQAILKKHGIKIVKEGRGVKASYYEEDDKYKRAITLYDEDRKSIIVNKKELELMNWDFLVFLAIITTPMLVFRGSYIDFLKYVDIKVTDANLRMLKDALNELQKRDLIQYTIDKTDVTYFTANIYHKVEEQMNIGIEMVKTCKQLADKYNKRSWVPLLKTWLGVQMLAERQPYTVESLCAITGLSAYQVNNSNKILKRSIIYRTSKAYADYQRCIGTTVELNGFFN